MKKWECTICGYIHEGDQPPDECPLCGADASQFVEVKEEAAAAAAPQAEVEPLSSVAAAQGAKPAPVPLQGIQALIDKHHLHPITVHMPNGIIPMAVFFIVMLVLFGSPTLGKAALYSYTFVLLSMPIVLFTGYTMWKTRYRGALTSVFKIKIAASLVATVLLATLVLWGFGQPSLWQSNASGRGVFLFFSLIVLAAVGIAGHLGGKLVFSGRKH
ncbi:MAG: rubredoxin-type Fe(Cys)4 protein [Desulfobulbaceae bacterium]|nr:rubredoxin-type Fe(Cys)4 protein [Desulfobulbaceae bacterium]